uniref:Uncharacterized protein n=1 Tax=Anguilla anguilla TaxID=7936 RepID=A0A0E9WDX2_ANGAN
MFTLPLSKPHSSTRDVALSPESNGPETGKSRVKKRNWPSAGKAQRPLMKELLWRQRKWVNRVKTKWTTRSTKDQTRR